MQRAALDWVFFDYQEASVPGNDALQELSATFSSRSGENGEGRICAWRIAKERCAIRRLQRPLRSSAYK